MKNKKEYFSFLLSGAVQFSVESTFRGGLYVVKIARIAQMEATSESGLHRTF